MNMQAHSFHSLSSSDKNGAAVSERFSRCDILEFMAKKVVSPMDKLTRTVERGFAAMDRGFAAVADDISEIKKTMATKAEMASGFLRVEERLYSIEQEIKDIKRRLTKLEDAFEKKGYQ